MNINLEYYKIFYYTAKAGSFTRASELLSVSQPAVSQAIRSLETEVGMPLFVRTAKGVHLTTAGEVLYSYVERGYESILMGEVKLKELQDLESGEIRIGASDMTLRFFLLPYLQKFHEAYPRIKLTVTNGPTPETLKYMQEGRIDFGVVTDPVNAPGEWKVLKMREISDIFVAGYRFLELKHRTISMKELERLPLICLEKNTSTRRYMDSFLKENKVFIQPEIELATSDMIVEFARRNFGVASVVADFAREYLDRGELFELKLSVKVPKRSIRLILEKEKNLSAAAQRLLDFLKEPWDKV